MAMMRVTRAVPASSSGVGAGTERRARLGWATLAVVKRTTPRGVAHLLRHLFMRAAAQYNGAVDYEGFASVMGSVGLGHLPLDDLFAAFDTDNDGLVECVVGPAANVIVRAPCD